MRRVGAAPALFAKAVGEVDDLDDTRPMSMKDAAIVGMTTVAVGASMWEGVVRLHDTSPVVAAAIDLAAPFVVPMATTLGSMKASEMLGVKDGQRSAAVVGTAAQIAWASSWVHRATEQHAWNDPQVLAALRATPQRGVAAEVAVTQLPHAEQGKLEQTLANAQAAGEATRTGSGMVALKASRLVLGAIGGLAR